LFLRKRQAEVKQAQNTIQKRPTKIKNSKEKQAHYINEQARTEQGQEQRKQNKSKQQKQRKQTKQDTTGNKINQAAKHVEQKRAIVQKSDGEKARQHKNNTSATNKRTNERTNKLKLKQI